MTLEQILAGIEDAETKLATRQATVSPTIISEQMYRLGQFTSALEKYLGDCEAEYEVEWARLYHSYTFENEVAQSDGSIKKEKPMSATAAENRANVETAKQKAQIKQLTRYVNSSWRNQTGAMARINHLAQEQKSGGI